MLSWTQAQEADINQAFRQYPPASNNCALAAQAVLRIADAATKPARGLVIEPEGFAVYVQPKNGPSDWLHHVTTEVSDHCVDVLTGAGGHPRPSYLAEYFEYPEALTVRPVEDDEWSEL